MVTEQEIKVPHWLMALVEDVLVECVVPIGFIGQLGYRYWEPDDAANASDRWQLAVYPTPNEVRGQHAHDGGLFVSGFRFDVARLVKALSDVESVVWCSPASRGGTFDGPELSVTGTFAGKRVWVRFFSDPPPDEPAAFAVDPVTRCVTELPA